MSSAKRILTVLAACQILWLPTANAQAPQQTTPASHADAVARLSKQLRWHSEAESKQYDAVRDQVTQQVLGEIDGFISDNFHPGTATADQVKAGLDGLLGYKLGGVIYNVAFLANLPSGKFLIAGIELWRGGRAIADDAVSIRAYKETGNKFVLAASTDPLSGVVSLCVKVLPDPPVPGELWLMALADRPALAPPTVVMRLYAFDGEKFRTVWSPEDIVTEGAESAVQLTSGGFTVNKLFDPTGGAPHSPSVVIHEQYTLAADGPHMVKEWKAPRF